MEKTLNEFALIREEFQQIKVVHLDMSRRYANTLTAFRGLTKSASEAAQQAVSATGYAVDCARQCVQAAEKVPSGPFREAAQAAAAAVAAAAAAAMQSAASAATAAAAAALAVAQTAEEASTQGATLAAEASKHAATFAAEAVTLAKKAGELRVV